MTVTLGPKGNDFVFGGKHTVVAAEEVYGVRNLSFVRSGFCFHAVGVVRSLQAFVSISLQEDPDLPLALVSISDLPALRPLNIQWKRRSITL